MKPRSDSALFSLSLEDQEKLNEWFLHNHSYGEIQKLLAAEAPEGMGLQVHSTTLRRYYERVMPEYIASRRQSAVATARHLKTAISTEPCEFDTVTLDALKQRVFELTLSPASNPDTIYKLYRLVLRAKDQELAREKFEHDAAKSIMKNFDKIAKIMREKGKGADRAAIDRIRLILFGTLTNAEEPLTGKDYKTSSAEPADPSHKPEDSGSNPHLDSFSIDPEEKPETEATNANSRNTDPAPRPTSTIGDAIIMTSEKFQPTTDFNEEPPLGPEVFEPDPLRDLRVVGGTDYYGSYLQYEYVDGNNPQGDTKYYSDPTTGRALRRKQQ